MEVLFFLEQMHKRRLFSVRVYELVFTDQGLYFLHLGEDSTQLPMGQAMGGLAGAVAQRIADKLSEKSIAGRIDQIRQEGLDAAVANDKRSLRASYAEIRSVTSAAYKWNRWPHITFDLGARGRHKFTFNLKMENLEEERSAVLEFLRGKRPDIVPAA